MGKYRNFSPEYRTEAVKMVIETSRPVVEVARDLGINEGTLKELEKEVDELRTEQDFLRKRPPSTRLGTVTEKFSFIAAEKATGHHPPVIKMRRLAGGVDVGVL